MELYIIIGIIIFFVIMIAARENRKNRITMDKFKKNMEDKGFEWKPLEGGWIDKDGRAAGTGGVKKNK